MPNIQQPEMRRSGKDPLVQESAANIPEAQGGGPGGGKPEHHGPVPPDQVSPYGPDAPQEPDTD
ncbi:hypothetical protein Val02_20270 [Virgisporangium aliadipatigenens]|uniref:Uncharacterized protein n=1 Tax=Virgisporangium aliadipatigenens TaxID=741659 RepID=A0A8J3YJM1_9ACTN|nr:hypothetical protein [Virgisporangium aliadipatigenens]GIJ45141.1 hypothetical protein Val02_20270 [Virgisporangium aliadipatigenens]